MMFPSCRRILLFPLLSSPHGPNKVMLDPSCTWIRCTRVFSWYSNGCFNSDLVETFKTNAFNVSFNAFVLDRVIGPFGTCNGSFLVFLGWSTSISFGQISSKKEKEKKRAKHDGDRKNKRKIFHMWYCGTLISKEAK